MHAQTRTRIITAIIALSIFLGALFLLPNPVFRILMAVVALGLSYEWFGVIDIRYQIVGLFATAFCIAFCTFFPQLVMPLLWIAIALWILLFMGLNNKISLAHHLHCLAGPFVIAAAWAALVYAQLTGAAMLIHMLLFVWIADSSAYFCGRAIGKYKLAPNLSPGKTWEGALGGLIITLSITTWYASTTLNFPWNGIAFSLVIGSILVAVSILGDLYQSQQKRRANVKDSGTIMPGHGGLWDRLDSLLPVSVFYVLFNLVA